eukprot:TRINITY_DN3969_c0_g1_i1.p1 TRINITY_DN3969_c0_g1~~TRINITY_DN3969_c0_g1_i1.p1  ORF type:complete len:431 (+),score=56.37 TRINITY_DN3969_c0_g1_i1:25-1317(+)
MEQPQRKNKPPGSSFAAVPVEILVDIFEFLDPTSLLYSCSSVAKSWNRLAQASRLWRPIFARVATHGPQPKPRTCHTATVMGNHMYTVGGMSQSNTIDGIKKQVCVLSMENMEWTVFDTEFGFAEHSAAAWNGKIYIFGGFQGDDVANCTNDLYELQVGRPGPQGAVDPPTFQLLETRGKQVSQRSAHVALVTRNKMYVSGGWCCKLLRTFDDFFELDLPTKTWRALPHSPHAARAHTGFVYDDAIYLFGGTNNENRSLSDLQKFDINTEEWTICKVTGTIPKGRSRCRGVLFNDHFILIGGWDRLVFYDELYVLNVKHLHWSKISTHSMPAVVQHTTVLYQDRLYSFAGFIRKKNTIKRLMMPQADSSVEDPTTPLTPLTHLPHYKPPPGTPAPQPLPAVPPQRQREAVDKEGKLCNYLYCYWCQHAIR